VVVSDGARRLGDEADAASVFVENGAVRLHTLDNARLGASSPPVLVVPGWASTPGCSTGSATGGSWSSTCARPGVERRTAHWCAWEDHVADLRAVVASLGLDRPILVAFPRGSSYALGYALDDPDGVRGLVVGDYTAQHVQLTGDQHVQLTGEWADRQLGGRSAGVTVADRMPEHASLPTVEMATTAGELPPTTSRRP